MRASLLLMLAMLVLFSAVGVVFAKYESRKLFVQTETQRKQRDMLDLEWTGLQLEVSTLATNARIVDLAKRKLKMHLPEAQEIVVVKR